MTSLPSTDLQWRRRMLSFFDIYHLIPFSFCKGSVLSRWLFWSILCFQNLLKNLQMMNLQSKHSINSTCRTQTLSKFGSQSWRLVVWLGLGNITFGREFQKLDIKGWIVFTTSLLGFFLISVFCHFIIVKTFLKLNMSGYQSFW